MKLASCSESVAKGFRSGAHGAQGNSQNGAHVAPSGCR